MSLMLHALHFFFPIMPFISCFCYNRNFLNDLKIFNILTFTYFFWFWSYLIQAFAYSKTIFWRIRRRWRDYILNIFNSYEIAQKEFGRSLKMKLIKALYKKIMVWYVAVVLIIKRRTVWKIHLSKTNRTVCLRYRSENRD